MMKSSASRISPATYDRPRDRLCRPPEAAGPGGDSPAQSVTAGEFVVDPPTLINLGFEWFIDGDDNRNASVDVSYRKQGDDRLEAGAAAAAAAGRADLAGRAARRRSSPNMFAGSILDLEPDTAYEARFVLTRSRRRAAARRTKTVTVRTRPEPMPAAGGNVYHVYPPGYKGAKIEPAFEGLMCAYNLTCAGTDWATAGRPRVKAGRHHPRARRRLQVQPLRVHERSGRQSHGAARRHLLPDRRRHGREADRRSRAPATATAIFDGAGNFALFDVKAADYTYFEGLTFRNTDIAIWAGTQFIAGAKGLTVKHCRFEDVGAGVFTNYSGSSNFYIADNYFIGRDDPNHVIGWAGEFWTQFDGVDGQKFPPVMASYVAVKVYGPGHVVAYNYVANFHDGIDIGDLRQSGRLGGGRRPEVSAAGVLGPAAGRDRLLQQLHDQLPRQPVRDRRQHAQRPRACGT